MKWSTMMLISLRTYYQRSQSFSMNSIVSTCNFLFHSAISISSQCNAFSSLRSKNSIGRCVKVLNRKWNAYKLLPHNDLLPLISVRMPVRNVGLSIVSKWDGCSISETTPFVSYHLEPSKSIECLIERQLVRNQNDKYENHMKFKFTVSSHLLTMNWHWLHRFYFFVLLPFFFASPTDLLFNQLSNHLLCKITYH